MPRPAIRLAEWLYTLAYLGAFLSFIPLLILLLPRRVESITGTSDLYALSWLLLAGGTVASIAHIGAGLWSDHWFARHASRRGPIGVGVAATMVSYFALARADTLAGLGAALIGFQIAVNIAFAPIGALLSDYVTDERKGRVAGRLNTTLPISIAAVSVVSLLFPNDSGMAFIVTGAAGSLMILPMLVWWPFGEVQKRAIARAAPREGAASARRDFFIAAGARLLVQLGAVVMTSYLYAYLTYVAGHGGLNGIGTITQAIGVLSLVATIAAVMAPVLSGLVSDLRRNRRIPLAISAVLVSAALMTMGAVPQWAAILLSYALFHSALASFLAIDSALVAQIVSGHPHRGTLLGVMNLTNTLPSIIAPGLALFAIQSGGLADAVPQLVTLSAFAALVAAGIILTIRSVR